MSKQLLHIGVYGIVYHCGKILLVTKSRGPYTTKLDLPGGRLEHGETPIEAVRREIFEEAGARVKDATLHDVWSTTVLYHENGQDISLHHIGIIYKVDLFDADVIGITNQNEDVSDVDWYDIMLVNENQMTPFVYSEWQRFCNRSDRKIRHTS